MIMTESQLSRMMMILMTMTLHRVTWFVSALILPTSTNPDLEERLALMVSSRMVLLKSRRKMLSKSNRMEEILFNDDKM